MAPARERPAGVTLLTILLYLYGLATIAAGGALIWWRDQSIAQLPVLLARVDDALPFDWADWQYVAAAGAVLVLVGILVMVCAGFLGVGSRLAYVVLLVLSGGLVFVCVFALKHVSDDLAALGIQSLLAVSAVMLLGLLLVLVGRRSRRFLWS